MLGAAYQMAAVIPGLDLDAQVGRQGAAGIAVLRSRLASGTLGDVVVVHLGNNGPLTVRQVNALVDTLAGVPHVVVLTVRIPDDFEAHNNKLLTQIARGRANVVLVDWHAASEGRPGLFWNDGEHVRPEGARVYASLIASALRENGIPTR